MCNATDIQGYKIYIYIQQLKTTLVITPQEVVLNSEDTMTATNLSVVGSGPM